MEIKFMEMALKEAEKSRKNGDVPVGTIITYNQEVIAKGYNMRNKKNSTLKHAELIAIETACRRMKDWRLEGCDIYVTMEPCPMCAGAILQARMNTLIYGCHNEKSGACGTILNILENDKLNHKVNVVSGIMEEECSRLLKDFFNEIRRNQEKYK